MNYTMRISREEIELLVELENGGGFGEETCFDYVAGIYIEGNEWVVEVFVEPVGDITMKGKTLKEVLEFWLELFRTQPKDWGYAKAGGHLEKHLHLRTFMWNNPANARQIWALK